MPDHGKTKKRRWAVAAVLGSVAILSGALLLNSETTYTIRDEHSVIVHTTSARESERILNEVGISLADGDRTAIEKGPQGPQLQIQRKQTVTVEYYGRTVETESWGETVAQLLERLELAVQEGDFLSLPPETETYDGMTLKICRQVRQEQIYTVNIPSQTVYCSDPSLPEGETRILIQGTDGEMLRRALVTYHDGSQVSREILSEEVTVQPVDRLVAVGSGKPEETPESNGLVIGNGVIRLPTGEVLTYSRVISSLATAYCDKGKTATGTQARVGAIAVDPEYIPYGTRMFIVSKDGEYIYGIATAEDCGSKEHIYGTRIDLHYDTRSECILFGARMCWVYFLS